MLRVIHAFDVRPGVVEHSFMEWLDGRLDEITKRFGCLERKTWVFMDGIKGDYEKAKPERRPKAERKTPSLVSRKWRES